MQRTLGLALIALITTLVLPCSGLAGTTTVLISAKKIVIKDNEDVTRKVVKFISKDPVLDPAFFGLLGHDWNVLFHSVDTVEDGTGGVSSAGWTQKGEKFKYKRPEAYDSPIQKASFKPGKLVIKGKGDHFYEMMAGMPQGTVALRVIEIGTGDGLCAVLPGMNGSIKKDNPEKGVYVAVKAEAPTICPSLSE